VFELRYGDFEHGVELLMQAMAIDLNRQQSGDASTAAACGNGREPARCKPR
jgi:hypothetical protein